MWRIMTLTMGELGDVLNEAKGAVQLYDQFVFRREDGGGGMRTDGVSFVCTSSSKLQYYQTI